MAEGVFEGLFGRQGPVKKGCAVKVVLWTMATSTAVLTVLGHVFMGRV